MEKQDMAPAATNPTDYLFTVPQTPQMPASDMDWATLFLSDPEQAPVPYETDPNTSGTMAAALTSEDQNNISNCPDRDKEDQDRNKEKRRASRISRRKAGPPRVEFQTKSSEDLLDDGYRWRKYGQKSVKNSLFPRSYYRCTHHTCNVKKQVQRLSKDTSIVVTTYEGIHNHPCEKIMETLSPLLKQMQFLASF